MAQIASHSNDPNDFVSNLNRLASECKSKLLTVSQTLVGETDRLEGYLMSFPIDQLPKTLNQLAHIKQDIQRAIDEAFNQIEGKIRETHSNLPQDHYMEQKAQNIFERISQDQKMVSDISKDLNSKDRFLEALQRLRETDFDRELLNIQNEITNYGNLVDQSHVSLVSDTNIFPLLNHQLKQHILLQTKHEVDPQDFSSNRATPMSLNERPMNVENVDDYQNIVYQHSPIKQGGTVQKGSRRTTYVVQNSSQIPMGQENRVAGVEPRRQSNMSIHSENLQRGPSPPIYPIGSQMSTDEGHVQQVLASVKKEPFEFHNSTSRRTEPDARRPSGFEDNLKSSPISGKGPVVLTESYFDDNCNSKYLHFFQDNSKRLHILDIQKALKTGQFSFEQIDLEIDFRIPIWHRSIITRQGTIYLTGGSGGGPTKDKNINDVYVYDPLDNSMRQKAKMNYARNCHGICVLQDHIYVVGGCIDEEGYTTSCERYEFSRHYERTVGEWEVIAPLNKAAYGPCLVNYNDTYLYKFGGILNLQTMNNVIERYNPQVDQWTEISYNLFGSAENDFNLMAYCGGVQISGDEIYIFGGSKFESKTDQNYVCRTSNDTHVIQKLDLNLPCTGAFWNNGFVVDGKVYCLQNVQLNKSEAVFLSKRRLLCYDGRDWREIDTQ